MTKARAVTSPLVAVILLLGLLLAACGSPTEEAAPTSAPEPAAPTADDSPTDGADATEAEELSGIERVYAEIEGLDREQRREKLLELAAEEEGAVMFYGSPNQEDISPVLEGYTEATGIDHQLFRAGAREVFQRILQEAQAGRVGADVVLIGQEDMTALQNEGLLSPLQTPLMDDLVPDGRGDSFAPAYLAVHVAAWNTDQISEAEQPSSWEELLTSPPAKLTFDQSDYAWFATLVTEYFMKELGMTEEEGIAVFKDVMPSSTVMRGHSAGTELLIAGEFPLHADLYMHDIRGYEGAPIGWEPALEPLIYLPFAVGITSDSPRPASALLLVDYILGAEEGQAVFADVGRTPANTLVEKGAIPSQYESMGVPEHILTEERDRWEQIWLDEVVVLVGDDRT